MMHVLKGRRGEKVVTPISSSKLIEDIAKVCNAEVVWTRVGSVDVTYKMKELKATFGCEENGGCFYAPHQPVRDGGMTTLLMLEAMLEMGKSLSEIVEELPKYYIEKTKVECPNQLKEAVMEKVKEYTESYERITVDGVKLFLPNGTTLIRPSGTEPIFRTYSEAKSAEEARKISNWATSLVKRALREAKG
jgi:phosphomannomutase/phosphoglucomutase